MIGLVSLCRAVAVEVESVAYAWRGAGEWQTTRDLSVVLLVWAALLLVPLLITCWIAFLSRTNLFLALAAAAGTALHLAWINGSQLMLWHAVRATRPHGMSLNFELSVLGVFCLWPTTLAGLLAWAAARRWLRRRAAGASPRPIA